ncbi:MAG: class I fructose-bisphosphate aldolase [Alphaproteobacteria bacterium]
MSEKLADIAAAMVAPGKGLLAADESAGTIKNRFDQIDTQSSETSRRDYREMLFRTTPAMSDHISGVILFDETVRQNAADGSTLVEVIKAAGAVPGIKVDMGAKPLAANSGWKVTEGLDGLRERLAEYHALGARFAKWRAVIDIIDGAGSSACIKANAHALARYAALCQEAGIVPIVEPEVMMQGATATHDIDTCFEVTQWTLNVVFNELYEARVDLEGMILKPNMVIAATSAKSQASAPQVAEKTVQCLKACVPAAVPGIAFLSGGQSDIDATAHLSLINQIGNLPWTVTFSYGRALQAAPLRAWAGKVANLAAGQAAFAHRARMNGLAALGQWLPDLENNA